MQTAIQNMIQSIMLGNAIESSYEKTNLQEMQMWKNVVPKRIYLLLLYMWKKYTTRDYNPQMGLQQLFQ